MSTQLTITKSEPCKMRMNHRLILSLLAGLSMVISLPSVAAVPASASNLPACTQQQMNNTMETVNDYVETRPDVTTIKGLWNNAPLTARDKVAIKEATMLPCLPAIDISKPETFPANVRAVTQILSEQTWKKIVNPAIVGTAGYMDRSANPTNEIVANAATGPRPTTITYADFLGIVARYPYFCGEKGVWDTTLEACQRELATFFAHGGQETGVYATITGTVQTPIDRWKTVLAFTRESACYQNNDPMLQCSGYDGWADTITPANSQCSTCPVQTACAAQCKSGDQACMDICSTTAIKRCESSDPGNASKVCVPCDSNRCQSSAQTAGAPATAHFYGRGLKQLSYFYNYTGMSGAFTGDYKTFLNNPDYVASEGYYAVASGLWFYMTPQSPKPSIHEVMVGTYQPIASASGIQKDPSNASVVDKFAATVSVINGAIECYSNEKDFTGDSLPKSRNRFNYFKALLGEFNATLTPIENSYITDTTFCAISNGNPFVANSLAYAPQLFVDTGDAPSKQKATCKVINYSPAQIVLNMASDPTAWQICKDKFNDLCGGQACQ